MNDDTINTNTDDALVNLTDEESINLFVEGLMDEKGINATSEELKRDIFLDLKTRLLEEIDRSLIAELPEENLDELAKTAAVEGKIAPEVVAKMVEDANLNVEEIVGVTMAKFRDLYLGSEENGAVENGAE